MGPAKGSRTLTKIKVKLLHGDPQHQEDPTSSSKVKLKKRKMSDLGTQWSKDELMRFYEAYRRHGKNWRKVSAVVGGKSTEMVEALYSVHQNFLSLPERQGTAVGFIALVTGDHTVLDESPSQKESDQTVRASGKTRKRGEAAQQKENESPHPHHAYHERRISGFSSSFGKRYCGELLKYIRKNPAGRRTPRIPVLIPSDINATDEATPEIKISVHSTKRANKEINNDGIIFAMNGYSPDASSGITEVNKVVQGQTLFGIKGTGDTEISQTQQQLKKRRIDQSMDEGQISKVEHETAMVAKEGNAFPDFESHLFTPDEMFALDVLESLPSKILQPMINIPSDRLGINISASSHTREAELSPVDQSKTRNKRRNKSIDDKVSVEEQNNSVNNIVLPEECQADTTERPSLNSESERGVIDLPESTANISAEVSPDEPMEINPRKINMSRKSKRKFRIHYRTKHVSCSEGADNLQERKMLHCLSSESLRRWCTYEWFYSAVDYPWFMNNEFVNYLNFANLSHLSSLTRSEWSTIRSSLGKPRRFSDQFLTEEKVKLENYRRNVRRYYAELSDGSRDALPADLARPFSVGQQVIVRHPSTRELCVGKVVMMELDAYKIQFDRPDLGVAVVKDTDCMPVNWSDSLPDDLKRRISLSTTHIKPDIEQIPDLTSNESWDHIMNEVSESSRSPHIKSDEGVQVESAVASEMQLDRSNIGRSAPLHSLQAVDAVQYRGGSNNSNGHSHELDSYITAVIQNLLSQGRQVFREVMQEISVNGRSPGEETCTSNLPTICVSLESEAALRDAQLPSNLILNCIATLLAIKDLSEYRRPPPNVAGVLERAFSMLRPSCSENLTIYNEIESYISLVKRQILSLVPATSGNGISAMLI